MNRDYKRNISYSRGSKIDIDNKSDVGYLLDGLDIETRQEIALRLLSNRDGKSKIYFIGNRAVDRVKIGISKDVKHRLNVLQSHSPLPLQLFKVRHNMTITTEQALHRLFENLNTHGEWFILSGEIQALINKL